MTGIDPRPSAYVKTERNLLQQLRERLLDIERYTPLTYSDIEREQILALILLYEQRMGVRPDDHTIP